MRFTPSGSYKILETVEEAIFWLKNGEYRIADFCAGKGLYDKQVGGCYGYFDEGLLETLVREEYIYPEGRLRRKGFAVAAEQGIGIGLRA